MVQFRKPGSLLEFIYPLDCLCILACNLDPFEGLPDLPEAQISTGLLCFLGDVFNEPLEPKVVKVGAGLGQGFKVIGFTAETVQKTQIICRFPLPGGQSVKFGGNIPVMFLPCPFPLSLIFIEGREVLRNAVSCLHEILIFQDQVFGGFEIGQLFQTAGDGPQIVKGGDRLTQGGFFHFHRDDLKLPQRIFIVKRVGEGGEDGIQDRNCFQPVLCDEG
ncbi:MAG: hypothetical protein ACD_87C00230G0002 [uncultured bacterium]|nr:MAG: hypothetical protein ACD_87C00230G0002 [uncultured bacterium]